MQNLSFRSSINQQFKHDRLYKFWMRSQGLWFSKLVEVNIRLLDKQELLTIGQRSDSLEALTRIFDLVREDVTEPIDIAIDVIIKYQPTSDRSACKSTM